MEKKKVEVAKKTESVKRTSSGTYDLIVIGGGIAAHTAAIYASRAGMKLLVLSGSRAELDQLSLTSLVENYPGFPEGVMGPELIQDCKKQAEKFGAKYVYEKVESLEKLQKYFVLKTKKNTYNTISVIICTGASPRRLGVPGEKELWGRGFSACATCDAPLYKGKTTMVIGGGDSAMEETLALTKFSKKVYLVHRRDKFRASKIMQDRVLALKDKVEIIYDANLVEVKGDKSLNSATIDIKGKKKEISVDGVFYAIGHIPNAGFLKGIVKVDKLGYIVTDKLGNTSVPGLYAAGDVQDPVFRQAVTSAGTGCMAALNSEKFSAGCREKWKYN